MAPSEANSSAMPSPETTASTPQVAAARRPFPLIRPARCSICSRMSATSSRDTTALPSNRRVASSGSSVCTCTFSVCASPTTSTESPIASSGSIHGPASSPSPVTAKFVQ